MSFYLHLHFLLAQNDFRHTQKIFSLWMVGFFSCEKPRPVTLLLLLDISSYHCMLNARLRVIWRYRTVRLNFWKISDRESHIQSQNYTDCIQCLFSLPFLLYFLAQVSLDPPNVWQCHFEFFTSHFVCCHCLDLTLSLIFHYHQHDHHSYQPQGGLIKWWNHHFVCIVYLIIIRGS